MARLDAPTPARVPKILRNSFRIALAIAVVCAIWLTTTQNSDASHLEVTFAWSATPNPVAEDAGKVDVVLTATLTQGTSTRAGVSVEFRYGSGTADSGTDYMYTGPDRSSFDNVFTTSTFTSADQSHTITFPFSIADDALAEGDETFQVWFRNPAYLNSNDHGTLVTPSNLTVTIHDNEPVLPPRNFVASHTANPSEVALSWDAGNDHRITGYQYRASADSGASWSPEWALLPGGASTSGINIGGLMTFTEYTFQVRALLTDGNSEPATTKLSTGPFDYDVDNDGLIEVTSLTQLDAMRWDLDGDGVPAADGASEYRAAFPGQGSSIGCPDSGCTGYELTRDLDFDTNGDGVVDASDEFWNEGSGWDPVGHFRVEGDNTTLFAALFEGNGNIIHNMFVNRPATEDVGLFGAIASGGEVRNVGIHSVDVTGDIYVGALAGYNAGTISSSSVTGSVNGTSGPLGGMVGDNVSTGRIIGSYSRASAAGGSAQAGGLVGLNRGQISACYSRGTASATTDVGGLVGVQFSSGRITACFSTGEPVSTTGTGLIGGLVGDATGGRVTNSYWDTQTSGVPFTDGGGAGKTTAELQGPTEYGAGNSIYKDWNLDLDGDGSPDDPWDFGTSEHYPILRSAPGVQRLPSAPILTEVASKRIGEIDVSWTLPSVAGVSVILDFDVRYRRQSDVDWIDLGFDGSVKTMATLSGLLPDTVYEVQVRAENVLGEGPWSETGAAKISLAEEPKVWRIEPSITSVTLRASERVRLSVDAWGIQNLRDNGLIDDDESITVTWSDEGGGSFSEHRGRIVMYTAPSTLGTSTVTATMAPGACFQAEGDETEADALARCSAEIEIIVRRPSARAAEYAAPVNPSGPIPSVVTDSAGTAYAVFTPVEGGEFSGEGFAVKAGPGTVPNGEIIGISMSEGGDATNVGATHQRYTLAGSEYDIEVVDASGTEVSAYRLETHATVCVPLPDRLRSNISDVSLTAVNDDGTLTVLASNVRIVPGGLELCGRVSSLPATVAAGAEGAPEDFPPPPPEPDVITPDTGGGALPATWLLLPLTAGTAITIVATTFAIATRRRSATRRPL